MPALDASTPSHSTPAVMAAAVRAHDRARRARRVGFAALGGGGAALLAATASAVVAFMLGRSLRRR